MEWSKRKRQRLKDYDYSQNGVYFVTLCTNRRQPLFSSVKAAESGNPFIQLSCFGVCAQRWIETLSTRFPVEVQRYAIMPDHIHLVLYLEQRATRESPLQRKDTLSKCIGYLKMNVSKEIHQTNPDITVWQRSFYDRVIRSPEEHIKALRYVEENPIRWEFFYEKH